MSGKESVIIDNSLDGACAGAAYLIRHPDARVFVTSTYHLPARLYHLPEWDPDIRSTAICGVGCKRSPEELRDGFRKLKEEGVSATWFLAGAGYPEMEAAVRQHCTLMKAPDRNTVTDAVISLLDLGSHPRSHILSSIADAGRCANLKDEETRIAAELAVACMYRFFQLGDRESYPKAVRKLAGLEPITDEDRVMLRRYEVLGHQDGPDGISRRIKEVRQLVSKYGPLDALNVLVLGETGTGKERVARLLHQESGRAEKHFIAVNCAILGGAEMLESKLFGHVKGAFTGAVKDHEGLIAAADKGTLFLDEVGDTPPDTQAKLLRVIEDGTFTRLGSNESLKVDVRIVAATNMNLAEMVREGRFRIDLYYRLRELVIRIPPLRDRLEDMGQIVGSIRRELGNQHGQEFPDLSEDQIGLLKDYAWPGNIRQLHSVLNRAYLLGIGDHLEVALKEEMEEGLDLFLNRNEAAPEGDSDRTDLTLRQAQILYSMKVLEEHAGNLTATAKALGISVNTLKKLRREATDDLI